MKDLGRYLNKFITAALICLAVIVTSVYDGHFNTEAKITYIKTLKIARGNSYKLTIKGKKGKIKWSTNKKKVATVSRGGKVTAKAKGTAKVTGKLANKKYITTVTVYNGASSSGNVRLTDVSSGSGDSATISGDSASALTQLGQAIANRDTTITVALNETASAGQLTSQLFGVSNNYVNDYDYFSLRSYSYSATTSDTTTITYNISYRITKSYNDAFKSRLKSTMASLHLSGSHRDKIKKIHDYIVNHTDYVDGGYTAYNALIDGGAVCEGYALLFYEMCQEAGIDCRVVSGTAYGSRGEGNHAWNVVKDGDTWYNMDVTWDDTTDSMKYFMKSNSAFPNHYPDSRSNTFLNGLNRA